MLRCYKARKLIASNLYGELDERERARLEAHLDGCPRCAREARSSRATLARRLGVLCGLLFPFGKRRCRSVRCCSVCS